MTDLNIEFTTQGIGISAIRGGHRVHKLYIGYTEQEAREEFNMEYPDNGQN